ncbi:MAG: hypothetical protein ACLTKT_03125 [Clostridia bacterium]|nr:hypothetical protein [Clostridium sp.]
MGLFGNKNNKEKEYLESLDINSMMNEKFCLEVDEIYTIVGVGTVITGIVKSGMCHSGDYASLKTQNGDLDTTILNIDMLRDDRNVRKKSNGIAYRGEHVGINIRGIDKSQINKGDILTLK